MTQTQQVPVLDPLRGIGALSVCLFHLSCGNRAFLAEDDPVRQVASFGWLGVELFFVVSGFVIPYSLYLRSYRLADAKGFFLRRLKRLEPPYFACIFLVLALNFVSSLVPGYRGESFQLDFQQLLAHVAYLNSILGFGWINPVFWTLAIEFQYYFFIALLFPLINSQHFWVRTVTLLTIAATGFSGFQAKNFLLHWLPLFAMGMAAFHVHVGYISRIRGLALLGVLAVICLAVNGLSETMVGVIASVAILLCGSRSMPSWIYPCSLVGTISYSLYLIHVPIGGRVINFAERITSSPMQRYFAIFLAFVVSIAASAVFWRIIEKPSQRWAKGGDQKT